MDGPIQLRTLGYDSWETPEWLIEKLRSIYGTFDLDPAATFENKQAPIFYSKEDDGLTKPWKLEGKPSTQVFCNPPYGKNVGKWVEKGYQAALKENCSVVMLLKVASDTAWWHEYVMHASEILFIRGKVKFGGPGNNSPPFASCVVFFAPPKSFFRILRPRLEINTLERDGA